MRKIAPFLLVMLVIEVLVMIVIYIIDRKKVTLTKLLYHECVWSAYVYLSVLLYVTFFSRDPMDERSATIIPFSDIIQILKQKRYVDFEYIILNIIMLVPGGVLFQCIMAKKKTLCYILLFGACSIIIIEILQYITYRGIFDINDIIYNYLGYAVGVFCTRYVTAKISNNKQEQI